MLLKVEAIILSGIVILFGWSLRLSLNKLIFRAEPKWNVWTEMVTLEDRSLAEIK